MYTGSFYSCTTTYSTTSLLMGKHSFNEYPWTRIFELMCKCPCAIIPPDLLSQRVCAFKNLKVQRFHRFTLLLIVYERATGNLWEQLLGMRWSGSRLTSAPEIFKYLWVLQSFSRNLNIHLKPHVMFYVG